MATESDRTSIGASMSTLDIDALIASFESVPQLRDNLQRATVVIVPTDLSPQYEGPAFPESTRDVLHHLQDNLRDHAIVEAAVRDEDYVEFALRFEEVILPVLFLANHVMLPLVVGTLASYTRDYLDRLGGQKPGDKVTSELHVKRCDGTQVFVKYDGPVATYEREVLKCFRDLGLSPKERGPLNDNEENDSS